MLLLKIPHTRPAEKPLDKASAASVSGQFNGLTTKLGRRLFYDALQLSTQAYWQQQAALDDWCNLGNFIEYRTRLIAATDEKGQSSLLIAVRADRGRRFERVRLSVTAKSAGQLHRDVLDIDNLGEQPVLLELPRIGWLAFGQGQRERLRFKGSVFLKLEEALNMEGQPVDGFRKVAEIFRPSLAVAQVGEFVLRWGRGWNVALLNEQKRGLQERLYKRLVKSAGKLGRPLRARRAIYNLMSSQSSLSFLFWRKNLGRADQVRALVAGGGPGPGA